MTDISYTVRYAEVRDIPAITRIYNQGIEDRIATLETRLRDENEMLEWLQQRSERHKVLVVEDSSGVHGWAALNVFNPRAVYSGVADLSIYIERSMRGKGLGKLLLSHLIEAAKSAGFHKLVLSTFEFNDAGQKLYAGAGFRKVGVYIKQGILDGQYIDVCIMEKLLLQEQGFANLIK